MFWIKKEIIDSLRIVQTLQKMVIDKRHIKKLLRQCEHALISKTRCCRLWTLQKEFIIIFIESLKVVLKISLTTRQVWEELKSKNKTKYEPDLTETNDPEYGLV